MIDLHCHILPGIDDGPSAISDSIALAKAAAAAGTRTIVATPHVSWRYPNESATIASLTAEVNEQLAKAGIPIEVRAGAEIAMTRASELDDDELTKLRLGGGPWLLLEPPFSPAITGFAAIVGELQGKGHRILLAHPERCPAFHRDPQALEALVNAGVLTSITAGSLVGRFGGQVRRFTTSLIERGWVHNIASDAHDAHGRPPGMASELANAHLGDLAEWLTHAVPEAILAGTQIPPRPARTGLPPIRRRRARWWRR
ncbi:MAG: tyrosine-protein phosphatase [Solirubrobacteraceae bacterium]